MTETECLLAILRAELARHPRLAAVDLQKLVYQAAFGADHWLAHGHHFERALRHEWDALAPKPGGDRDQVEPVLQVIDPEGRTARLHLGPCRACGVALDELASFLGSQAAKLGSQARYDELWRGVVALARDGAIPIAVADLAALPQGEHPPHHSAGYGATAYRVVNDVTHSVTAEWLRRHLE